jgi:hypothetical protein
MHLGSFKEGVQGGSQVSLADEYLTETAESVFL